MTDEMFDVRLRVNKVRAHGIEQWAWTSGVFLQLQERLSKIPVLAGAAHHPDAQHSSLPASVFLGPRHSLARNNWKYRVSTKKFPKSIKRTKFIQGNQGDVASGGN